MKKLITTLLILFLLLGLFAETGYQKHQWYSNPGDFPKYGRIEYKETPSYGINWPYIYKAEIQGESTFVYYCFSGLFEAFQIPEFISAGFYLTEKNAKEYIKKTLQNKTKVGVIEAFDIDLYREAEEGMPEEINDFFMLADFTECAKYAEEFGIEKMNQESQEVKKPNSKISYISIYDYNDDTRCYIFENFVPGRTAILFGPHTKY